MMSKTTAIGDQDATRAPGSRTTLRLLVTTTAIAVLATAGAHALPQRAATVKITPAGVGGVKLGTTYTALRAAGLVGKIGPGCELAGPRARSARLTAPLKGAVDFTQTTPRKAAAISVTGGAKARGVGIGATIGMIRRAFPKVIADHGTDTTFGLTLYRVPRGGGGRLELGVNTKTKRVTIIGIPAIGFCD
jgi:hypothetical protein